MNLNNIQKFGCICAVTALGFQAQGDTIYDSYSSYNGHAFSLANNQEIGSELNLNSSSWNLSSFSIEYYSPSATLASTVGVKVRFYLNDGAPSSGFASPGTLFYDSGWFYNTIAGSIPGNGFHSIFYTSSDLYNDSLINLPPGYTLPTDFTFTVSFTGLDDDNMVEIPLADNVTGQPATTFGDYWSNSGGTWSLLNNAAPANFVGNFVGAVPEPSTYLLSAVGGVLLLGVNKLRKKS